MFGSIECEVLNQVGQAPLILVLEHRSGVDNQPEFGAVLGLAVFPNPVTETVPELSGRNPGVDREFPAKGKLVGLQQAGSLASAWCRSGKECQKSDETEDSQ
jgi:hypothetical protein